MILKWEWEWRRKSLSSIIKYDFFFCNKLFIRFLFSLFTLSNFTLILLISLIIGRLDYKIHFTQKYIILFCQNINLKYKYKKKKCKSNERWMKCTSMRLSIIWDTFTSTFLSQILRDQARQHIIKFLAGEASFRPFDAVRSILLCNLKIEMGQSYRLLSWEALVFFSFYLIV